MSMRARYSMVAALIFLTSLSSVAQVCSGPTLRGSFLQPALGDAWTLEKWRDEFHYMRDARLDQMVIQWTADSKEKTTIYPSGVAGVKKPSPGDDNLSLWYTLTDLTGVNGRYVQVQVKPGWDAGWTFIDEIEVRQ